MTEISIGSRIDKSPYYNCTLAAGVTHFTIYNRMYMPTSYGNPLGEYKTLMNGVSIWDVGAERQVEIAGPDARAMTQYVSARSLTGLKPGRARYAPMANYDGHLINDPIALCLAEDRWWLSIADSDVVLFCQGVAGAMGFDVDVFEPDVSPLAIQGPLAEDLCRDLFGAEIINNIGFFHHREVELNGISVVICRSGWSRQGGFELFLTDGSRGEDLWNTVWTAGQKYDIAPGTPNQMERLENGLLSYRSDTAATTDPIEAGLGAYVNLDADHDFVGKEALLRRQADPSSRRPLVNVTIDSDLVAADQPWPATISGEVVGELRVASWSPKLGRNIGLALIDAAHADPATRLQVDAAGTTLEITVSDVPFGVSL